MVKGTRIGADHETIGVGTNLSNSLGHVDVYNQDDERVGFVSYGSDTNSVFSSATQSRLHDRERGLKNAKGGLCFQNFPRPRRVKC